ncbi:Spherulation-specific family 4, partial [Vararia minispora EC-137]
LAAAWTLPSVLGLGILYPLYAWPTSCSLWKPIADQISAHSDVQFHIIINPNNGPETSPADPAFQACIPTLTSAGTSTVVLGYVRTGYTTEVTAAEVQGNVSLYASWGSAYRPTGIFFDEVSNDPTLANAYASYAAFARSSGFNFVGRSRPITFNPGTSTDPSYFSSADLIVTFENVYSTFAGASSLVISPSMPAAKQAVILYAAPTTAYTSTIDTLASLGVGAVYMTDDSIPNPYDSVPTDWAAEVADVAA